MFKNARDQGFMKTRCRGRKCLTFPISLGNIGTSPWRCRDAEIVGPVADIIYFG